MFPFPLPLPLWFQFELGAKMYGWHTWLTSFISEFLSGKLIYSTM